MMPRISTGPERIKVALTLLAIAASLLPGGPLRAADPDNPPPDSTVPTGLTERVAVHGQFTYVEQETAGFATPYSGANSLLPNKGAETTDATLYLGARLWSGTEIWINPEIDQGFGLDDTLGVAGFPSGEAYKVGKNQPYLRLQRTFIRSTYSLDGPSEPIAGDANQLAGTRGINRWVFTVGKFSVGDIFDANQYAHDPRADFLNWTAIDAGTFDYAADAWGYTVGAAAERYQGTWTVRLGVFDLSNVPNSEHLEPGFHEFQSIVELEKRYAIAQHAGKVMVTVFDTRGRMGLLEQAVQVARSSAAAVDIAAVRKYRSRLGADVNVEQQLTDDLGAFARLGKSAGNVEAYEFTDIDRTFSLGLSLKGSKWRRADDTLGLAAVVNEISAARQEYLAAGGLGILVGDGQLPHEGPEQIIETYYRAAIFPFAQLSFDYQWIKNPGYNLDRGPVSVFAIRIHLEH
jgi:high affinity Mn2+ porin